MVPFQVPNMIRHPYKKDPQRDPTLENYPCNPMLTPFFGAGLKAQCNARQPVEELPLRAEKAGGVDRAGGLGLGLGFRGLGV